MGKSVSEPGTTGEMTDPDFGEEDEGGHGWHDSPAGPNKRDADSITRHWRFSPLLTSLFLLFQVLKF